MVKLKKSTKARRKSADKDRKLSFYPVEDPSELTEILAERLPYSSMMHNQVFMYKKHKDDLRFYTLGKEIQSSTWIVSNNIREDYGFHYGISAPPPFALGEEEIPPEVIEAFSSDSIIDWEDLGGNEMSFFVQTPKPVSDMIFDISTNKGKVSEVHPCLLYTMDKDECLQLEVDLPSDSSVQVRRLTGTKKDADFILSAWKYTQPGSEIVLLKCLERNASAGVFVENERSNKKCVCGVYIPAIGFLSALYTLQKYRHMGYARLAMRYTFKEFAKDGCIPCLAVEMQNLRSIRFHRSLGMKEAEIPVNFLIVKKLEFD